MTTPTDPREENEMIEITEERLREFVWQAAGAATAPLLVDHPDYVFPSERVNEAVQGVWDEFMDCEPAPENPDAR